MARALNLLASNAQKSPIVVKLSGHVQTNDRLAIREMGRQIALAEGSKPVEDDSNEDEAAGDGEGEVSLLADFELCVSKTADMRRNTHRPPCPLISLLSSLHRPLGLSSS